MLQSLSPAAGWRTHALESSEPAQWTGPRSWALSLTTSSDNMFGGHRQKIPAGQQVLSGPPAGKVRLLARTARAQGLGAVDFAFHRRLEETEGLGRGDERPGT